MRLCGLCRFRRLANGGQLENEFLMKELISLRNRCDLVFAVPAIDAFGTFVRVDERAMTGECNQRAQCEVEHGSQFVGFSPCG